MAENKPAPHGTFHCVCFSCGEVYDTGIPLKDPWELDCTMGGTCDKCPPPDLLDAEE